MTTNSTSHLRSFAKGALLVSAAFPLSALIVAESANAEQTVEVSATETAASVQAKIDAAKATPDRDISIAVTSKGTVTGPGTIGISPIAGQGDGAIVFGNAGSIGAVDKAGAVTDSVGVVLNGSSAKADNTLTATNSGLVTGGFSATGFGGTVSLDNSGTIHNGVILAGKSDVKIASTGAVRSGNVVVAAVETTKSTVSGDTTTDVTAGGNATGTVGDVASADGKTKGNVTFFGQSGNADGTVTGTAGTVLAYSGGAARTIENTFVAAPPAGKTTVTNESNTTYTPGSAKLATTAKSKVDEVLGFANGNVEIAVAGSVVNDVRASLLGNINSTNKTTVTLDGAGGLVEQVFASSTTSVAGNSKISVAEGASVGGNVNATASGDASVENAGEVEGTLTANAGSGGVSSFEQTENFDGKGVRLSYVSKQVNAPVIGSATVVITETGSSGGSVLATATKDASVANGGSIGGSLTANAGTGNTRVIDQELVYDSTGALVLSNVYEESNTRSKGNASVVVAAGAEIDGGVVANATQDITINNAGTIGSGVTGNSSGNDSTYVRTELTPEAVVDAKAGTTTTKYSEVIETTNANATGKIDFTNAAGGVVGFNGVGTVDLNAGGDITILNQGEVRGITNARSSGGKSATSDSYKSTSIVDGKGGSSFAEERASSNSYTATGGSVTGTYAGANGTKNFVPAAIGNVTQVADLASTVTVTGSVFGNVNSTAGNSGVAGTLDKSSSSEAVVLDVDANGTRSGEYADSYEATAISGGDSKVVIAGQVATSNAGGSASVFSQGTNSSSVAVSGSVEQDVTSNAFGANAIKSNNAGSFAQTITKGTPVTDELNVKFGNSVVVTDGVASASITGKASASRDTVGGSVSVNGVKSATVDVASKAVVGGNLFVNARNGTDSESSTEQSYVRDAKTGVATASEKIVSTSGDAAAQGNAAATIAGTVEGGTYVNAGRGNATVTLTGVSEDYVTAIADGSVTKTTIEREWTGKTKSASENFGTLVGSLTGRTLEESITTEITRVGGKATVLVDSVQALKDKATAATDDVYAYGVSGASVEITKGSIIASDVEAESVAFNSVTTSTTSNDGKGTVNLASETKTTIVGGPASVTNAGLIGDDVFVTSATSATVNNTGKIGDNVSASAIVIGSNSSSETTNFGKASLQTTTDTSTPVVALGKASVTNATGATIGGDIFVEAGEGTVTNNGTVRGTTFLGRNIDTGISTVVRTDTSTEESYTPAAALLAQTYTVNQNGVSGGFDVRGGLDNDPTGEGRVKTSDVKATINLNSGSATLGSIFGEVDEDGNRTTNTTVNLVGSGFLGADAILYPNQKWPVGDDKPNPVLSLGKDAQDLFGGSNYQVRVVGVETLNKEGAGTFVINGAAYEPALPGGKPSYTLDVGNFNIKAGEVQLTTSQAADAEFGVRGNINNAATLVLGRRITPGQNQFGNSLVGQTELIDGITVRQVGDYNQTAAGTTVVGLTPTLVRVYRTAVGNGDSLPEPLAPVAGNVSVGYFTTPALADAEVDPSRVNITGNLNLAGKVAVNVYRDSLYANGDGYTLFTYTGTGAVSAAAAPTLTSPFVGFTLVHDTAKKEVRLEVKRSSYAGGANNPNAVAAATGLDSALASAITKIRTDAAGGAGFASVTELGYAQDIANVATALDFRLSSDQAAQLFNELSSGEVYGSLAAVDQNGVFGQMLDVMTNRRSFGGDLATQLWLNPVGNWAKYGDGDAFGASDIRANSYGLAGGVDFAYAADGAFGFGGAYAEHDIAARGTPEAVDGRTWTVGAYVTQGFGPIYANAKLAYGWTNYDATRTMGLLARTAEASINAKQFDVSLEAGYDYRTGSVTITPYGKLVLRRTSLEGFTETGAGAFSLDVEGRKKTVFSPVLGVKLGTETELSDSVTLRPFARASYTFQGNLPSDITARYVGGGDAFILKGAEPDSFGMIEAGFEAKVADRLNLFFTGSQTFGGDNKVTGLRGGVTFQF
ncbi:autotransporter outer membrane beta-barrel domain-containing protein [Sphingopyxis sp.]|jgi:uncharacterized protein YhjY with autotransporter beta-barrel domain|uniref:autotransporter outer membrane beta-barrel domain-containing protein n=1 Tax=Sphingopyxis sp. TaxID=1908224 RepID=UPI002E076881|nr:autotransporter outer membrane beta-barrel domain-containing protein [Sphingopyxis sp.]